MLNRNEKPPPYETSIPARFLIEISQDFETQTSLKNLDDHLESNNALIFFDHVEKRQVPPLLWTLYSSLSNLKGGVVPRALHLDMELDKEGNPSFAYKLRTKIVHFGESLAHRHTNFHFQGVNRRHFEGQDHFRKIIEESPELKTSTATYTHLARQVAGKNPPYSNGFANIIAPMAGAYHLERPALDPYLYRLIKLIYHKQATPVYFAATYPIEKTIFGIPKHTLFASGPHYLDFSSEINLVLKSYLEKFKMEIPGYQPDIKEYNQSDYLMNYLLVQQVFAYFHDQIGWKIPDFSQIG